MPPHDEIDTAILKNELKHLTDAVERLSERLDRMQETIEGVRLSQAKFAGMLAVIGTGAGGAGAAITKLFF